VPRPSPLRFGERHYPRRGLHGQIVHNIGCQILRGEIQPGDVVPFDGGLPASRTVLREAIKVLAAKGLVESRPKTGTRVRPRQSWNLLDPDVLAWQREGAPPAAFLRKLTEVRRIVEPATAELAAERASAREVAGMEEAYLQMESALAERRPDFDAFNLADMRFHRSILEACHNDVLEQMSRVVFGALLVSFHATSRLPGSAKASLPRHREILEAIRDKDGRLAAQAMRRLVQSTARDIDASLKRPGGRRQG
jgi:GntR family transcriptional regulator, galactonate operon transcriptional repressor